ncbi:DUF536 domain-containing protein [Enterococcus faecalis]|uniref:DUF536 domain-containing protein n=1 Tax=Enterococcus faecalis TaxID=1351 RepID=UPI001F06B90C|nr:DUF536 domain-containing protein [Enterococcus faecalis]MCH1672942.1 DUF536 domain-containing protein [Enterococcus faecalis]
MDKTIKQLADELNISKRKVAYQVNKLSTDLYYKKDNIVYIKNAGIKEITSNLSDTGSVQKSNNEQQIVQSQIVVSQLDKKDRQLEIKDEQIATLQKLLDQQQQLSLQAQQRVEKLEKQLAIEPPKDQEQTDQELESWQISEYETKIKSLENNLEETKEELQERDKVMRYLKQEYDIDSLDDLVEFAEGDSTRKWWQFWRR